MSRGDSENLLLLLKLKRTWMMNLNRSQGILSSLVIVGVAAGGLASCGNFTLSDRAPSRVSPHNIENEVPDLSGNQMALGAIQGISVEQSVGIANKCADIVLNAPMDRSFFEYSEDKQDSFHSFYCELTDEQLSKTFYEQVKSTKTDGTNVGDDMDVRGVIKAVPAAVTNKFNYSQNSVKDYSTAMAKQDASLYHKTLCTTSDKDGASKRNIKAFTEVLSPEVAKVYGSCVATEQKGFSCNSRTTKDGISLELVWAPSETARQYLPKVKLDFKTMDNLELRSSELPKVLGVGTGEIVTFAVKDATKVSTVQVVAQDRGKAVTFACTNIIEPAAKPVKLVWAQHPACGEQIEKRRMELSTTETVDDTTKPIVIAHVEMINYGVSCGHAKDDSAAKCAEKGWVFKGETETKSDCQIKEGIRTRKDRSLNVAVTCERIARVGFQQKPKEIEASRLVTPACLMDESIPGVKAISPDVARDINNVTVYTGG